MTQKIAVAIIHGMGKQRSDFSNEFQSVLIEQFMKRLNKVANHSGMDELVIEPMYWAPVLENLENLLWLRIDGKMLSWKKTRGFVISYLGDAIAYQPLPPKTQTTEHFIYKNVHERLNESLKMLAKRAGETAPLCVIAHSLGTIISSNFLYDLQISRGTDVYKTPLEKGETLTLYYTMGSPIAVWSLRFKDFGTPLQVPAPKLGKHYSYLEGEWINFYNKNDVLGFPIKNLNEQYQSVIKQDLQVNSGNFLIRRTPLSHKHYWTNKKVIATIADALVKVWMQINVNPPEHQSESVSDPQINFNLKPMV